MGKHIPASYVTKVPNGTVLVNILNKAAGEGKKGPFNKYDSVYYGGMGYYITAMNGTKEDPAANKSWLIVDQKSGGYTPCGVSFYEPVNGSTTIFKFTKYSASSSRAIGYCKVVPSHSQVIQALKITIKY